MRRQPQPQPPRYWSLFLRAYLGASEHLARQLWQIFPKSTALRYELARCDEFPSLERQGQVFTLIQPKDLLAAIERLCPPGKQRPRELVALGERILGQTTASGTWR